MYSRMLCIEGSALIQSRCHFGPSEPPFWRSNFVFVFVFILASFLASKRAPKSVPKCIQNVYSFHLAFGPAFLFSFGQFLATSWITELLEYVVFSNVFPSFLRFRMSSLPSSSSCCCVSNWVHFGFPTAAQRGPKMTHEKL